MVAGQVRSCRHSADQKTRRLRKRAHEASQARTPWQEACTAGQQRNGLRELPALARAAVLDDMDSAAASGKGSDVAVALAGHTESAVDDAAAAATAGKGSDVAEALAGHTELAEALAGHTEPAVDAADEYFAIAVALAAHNDSTEALLATGIESGATVAADMSFAGAEVPGGHNGSTEALPATEATDIGSAASYCWTRG